MGNDSSQYGRVEGAVSGCRPAGPQNVGQVVSVCLACSHLSLFPSSLPSQCHLPNFVLVSFVVFFRLCLLLLIVIMFVCHVSHPLRFILHDF